MKSVGPTAIAPGDWRRKLPGLPRQLGRPPRPLPHDWCAKDVCPKTVAPKPVAPKTVAPRPSPPNHRTKTIAPRPSPVDLRTRATILRYYGRRSWAGWAGNEMAEDPYKVLGVPRDAPDEEIRRAYRKLAKQLHPDLNPANRAVAEERFKRVSAASDIVGDPVKRKQYDRGENDASREPRRGCHRGPA